MPTPTHTRITLSGTFGAPGTPSEIWACNINTGPLQATTAANCVTVAGLVRAAWNTNINPLMSNDLNLTRTRVAVISDTGHVATDFDGSYKQGDDTTVINGPGVATSASRQPLQSALVISLRSARAGATGKGRFFLPFQPIPGNVSIGTDFRLSASVTDSYRNAAVAFIRAVNTAAQAPVVVASSHGYLSTVTQVGVGRVIDTMRSRRNAQPETTTFSTV